MNKVELFSKCIKSSENGCGKIYEKNCYDMLLALYEVLREINEGIKVRSFHNGDTYCVINMKYSKLVFDSLSQYDTINYGDNEYKILVSKSDNSIIVHLEVI